MMRYTGKATLELLDRVAGGGFKGTVEKAGMALEARVSNWLSFFFLEFGTDGFLSLVSSASRRENPVSFQ